MQDLARFAFASNLKWLLLGVMGVLGLWLLISAWRDVTGTLGREKSWIVHPVTVLDAYDAHWIAIEVDSAVAAGIPEVGYVDEPTPGDERVRIYVHQPRPGSGTSSLEAVLLQDPANPAQVMLLDKPLMWHRLAGAVAALLVLGVWTVLLLRAGWGQDLSWASGSWIVTPDLGIPAGGQSTAEDRFREPSSLTGHLVFLAMVVVATGNALRWVWQSSSFPDFAPAVFIGLLGVAVFAVTLLVENRTRRVAFDANGFSETTFFGARRVPWPAVQTVERRNVNKADQDAYDNKPIGDRKGSRPQTAWAWEFFDSEGREIISLGDGMRPESAFERFVARARGPEYERQQREEAVARNDVKQARETPELLRSPDQSRVIAQQEEMLAKMEQFHANFREQAKETDRSISRGFLLIMAPFALLTLWLAGKALLLNYTGERVEALVVAHTEDPDTRSLELEYRDATGETYRLKTNGTAALKRYSTGDTVKVIHPAGDPAAGKMDTFWEIWLWPIVSAVFTAMFSLPLLFMRI